MKARKLSVTMIVVTLLCILAFPTAVLAAKKPGKTEKLTYGPRILSRIDADTTEVEVYVYDHTTLFIRNGSRLIVRKSFGKKGGKSVRIPRQRRGSVLSFQLKNNRTGLMGNPVYRTVGGGTSQTSPTGTVDISYREGALWAAGPKGSRVYIRAIQRGHSKKWRKAARIPASGSISLSRTSLRGRFGDSFLVRLKLPGGRFTKAVRIDLPRDIGPSITL